MKLFVIFWAVLLGSIKYTDTSTVNISLNGISSSKGTIFINLYASENGFPTDMTKAIKSVKLPAEKSTMKYIFANLPKGTYAISVMHDENNNGKMDKNLLGIPTEGYCVSNNAKGFMNAPSFSDAKFELKKDIIQDLKLIY